MKMTKTLILITILSAGSACGTRARQPSKPPEPLPVVQCVIPDTDAGDDDAGHGKVLVTTSSSSQRSAPSSPLQH